MGDYDYNLFEVEIDEYESSYASTEAAIVFANNPVQGFTETYGAQSGETLHGVKADFSEQLQKLLDQEFPIIPAWLFYLLAGGAIVIILCAFIYVFVQGMVARI